jgi:hypothetical protein
VKPIARQTAGTLVSLTGTRHRCQRMPKTDRIAAALADRRFVSRGGVPRAA